MAGSSPAMTSLESSLVMKSKGHGMLNTPHARV